MKKSILYGMVTLTLVFALLAIIGTSNKFLKFYDINKSNNNNSNNNNNNGGGNDPKPEPKKPVDKKVDDYTCTSENCEILKGTEVINNKFEFISDGTNKVVLYDLTNKNVEDTYKEVTPAGNLYIVTNEAGLYGLLKIDDKVNKVYEPKYTYIQYNDADNHFMVTLDGTSFITDEDGKKVSSNYTAQIMQYSDKYIVTKTKNNEYHVFSMNNKEYLTEYISAKRLFIEIVGDYIGIIDNNYVYKIYDCINGNKLIGEYQIEGEKTTVRARVVGQKIEIYDGSTVLKTIDL